MSQEVNIHLWLGEPEQFSPVEVFGMVLECIAIPKHSNVQKGSAPKRFEQLRIYDRGEGNVVLNKAMETNDVLEITNELDSYVGPGFCYEVESVFDRYVYYPRQCNLEANVVPLHINYYGPSYEWGPIHFKSYGPIVIYFFSKSSFYGSQQLKELNARSQRLHAIENAKISEKLSHNYDAVDGLAKRISKVLNPIHLLICTDYEISPLTSHGIYHRDWRDYLTDFEKILCLHEYGGVYFCNVNREDPAFIEPRKEGAGYGYLRHNEQDERKLVEFAKKIESLIGEVSHDPERIKSVSKDQLEACFYTLNSTKVEKINDSYYLSACDAPFAYLEEPYFELHEATYKP